MCTINETDVLFFKTTSSQCGHSPDLSYLSIPLQGQVSCLASFLTVDHSEAPLGSPARTFSFLLDSADSTGLEEKHDIIHHVRHFMNETNIQN